MQRRLRHLDSVFQIEHGYRLIFSDPAKINLLFVKTLLQRLRQHRSKKVRINHHTSRPRQIIEPGCKVEKMSRVVKDLVTRVETASSSPGYTESYVLWNRK